MLRCTVLCCAVLGTRVVAPARPRSWAPSSTLRQSPPHTHTPAGFLTPDLWRETVFTKSPLQEYSGERPSLSAAAAEPAAARLGAARRRRRLALLLHLALLLVSGLAAACVTREHPRARHPASLPTASPLPPPPSPARRLPGQAGGCGQGLLSSGPRRRVAPLLYSR